MGDLVTLVGRGDPDLIESQISVRWKRRARRAGGKNIWPNWPIEAAAKGLHEIEGDIVADDSYYPLRSVSSRMEHRRHFFHVWLADQRHRVERQLHFRSASCPAPSVGDAAMHSGGACGCVGDASRADITTSDAPAEPEIRAWCAQPGPVISAAARVDSGISPCSDRNSIWP